MCVFRVSVSVWFLGESRQEGVYVKREMCIPISVVYQRKGLAETGLTEVPHRIRRAALLAERRNEDMV